MITTSSTRAATALAAVALEGADSSISWRPPADCYEATKPSSARCDDDGSAFQLVVGGKPGMGLVESELDYRELAEEDSTVEQTTVDVAGRTFTVLVDDGGGAEDDTGIMSFLHQPEGSPDTFAVVMLTEAPVSDLPSTRVVELYQVLGALELEPA